MKKAITLMIGMIMLFTFVGCSAASASAAAPKATSTIEKIKTSKKIVIGTAPGYMPFEMTDVDGKFIGYDIDLGKAIGESLGVEVEFKQYEFSGLIPALQVGEIDILLAGMTIRGDRAAAVSFSDTYFATGQVLMVSAADTTTKTWEDLDVAGKTIALSQGTTGALLAKQLFKNAEVVDFADFPTASMAIVQGKADAIVYDEPGIKQFELMHPGEVKGIYDLISNENLGIAVKYNDLETVQWLNSFLSGYKNSPADLASIDKWFNSTDWMTTVAK